MLSANLGVMNLLPLPALDGGRLVFIILEMIRRKKVIAGKRRNGSFCRTCPFDGIDGYCYGK